MCRLRRHDKKQSDIWQRDHWPPGDPLTDSDKIPGIALEASGLHPEHQRLVRTRYAPTVWPSLSLPLFPVAAKMFEFLLAILSGILAVVCVGRILKQTAPKEEAQKVYNAFRDAGGNFIDTANVYTNGASERFAGEFAKGHRQSMVLATKYSNAVPGNDPNAAGNQRKSLMQAVEASCSGCRRITSIKALHPYYDN